MPFARSDRKEVARRARDGDVRHRGAHHGPGPARHGAEEGGGCRLRHNGHVEGLPARLGAGEREGAVGRERQEVAAVLEHDALTGRKSADRAPDRIDGHRGVGLRAVYARIGHHGAVDPSVRDAAVDPRVGSVRAVVSGVTRAGRLGRPRVDGRVDRGEPAVVRDERRKLRRLDCVTDARARARIARLPLGALRLCLPVRFCHLRRARRAEHDVQLGHAVSRYLEGLILPDIERCSALPDAHGDGHRRARIAVGRDGQRRGERHLARDEVVRAAVGRGSVDRRDVHVKSIGRQRAVGAHHDHQAARWEDRTGATRQSRDEGERSHRSLRERSRRHLLPRVTVPSAPTGWGACVS